MTPYLDASALVKRYVSEPGSADVVALTAAVPAVATALITRAEVAAALARAVRLGVLDDKGGRRARRRFAGEWQALVRVPITEALIARADALAWDHDLRGYDSVQLAAALTWQDSIGQDIVLATFDHRLWQAASRAGLRAWPDDLSGVTRKA